MTREEILTELARLAPWFHRIELGDGIATKTESVMGEPVDHPREPWEVIGRCLPDDLSGKTVLDVGCNGGFYCVEAKRRGARRVLGVDGQRQHVRQALFVRKVLDLDLEFRRLSVYDLDPRTTGRFDITLALGLVYHLKHLVFALERLFDVTNELLVVETAIIPPDRTPQSFVQPLGAFEQTLHPLFYAENPPEAKEQVFNWFLPGTDALRALLKQVGFQEVEVFSVVRDRAVLVCRKHETATEGGDVSSGFVAALALEGDRKAATVCRPGEEIHFRLRVENAGRALWPATGEPETGRGAVHLGAHLLLTNEDEVAWDYGRARLPRELSAGESAVVEISLRAPAARGSYVVEFDMVAEHLAWFEDFGSGTLRHELVVE